MRSMGVFLKIGEVEGKIAAIDELRSAALARRKAGQEIPGPSPRIALLTPYNGGNLGDAAIQDSMIANIRDRLPGAQFSGICLNCDNFVERHGIDAFPLCGITIPFYGMLSGKVADQPRYGEGSAEGPIQKGLNAARIKRALKRVPVLGWYLIGMRACWREFRHWVQGYGFVRAQDLVIVSGGGQMSEEWGGPWGQPFALFKWAVLARTARVPYVIASVGVGKVTSPTARSLLSAALRMARYRSYRDENSRAFAAGLLPVASKDPIVPDVVLSLPSSEIPRPAGIRAIAQGRPTIAISPIAYAKPRKWPSQDRALYDRYISEMARVVSQLLERGHFLVIICSCLWDDESAIADLLGRLDDQSKQRLARQIHIPPIATWKDVVASLLDVDYLIASRLHSVILGWVVQKPTVAISFDAKVDWVMADLGQSEYLLQIREFTAGNVMEALDRLSLRRNDVVEQLASCRDRIIAACAPQYDALAELAAMHQG
jgi:polysaccharide pyruvyl transferase WcaK-like protein